MTWPDLAYSVHQCARFCNNPKLLHEQGLKCTCRYLYLTRGQGLVFKPNLMDRFKCYVDADWARNWLKTWPNDKTGALSHTGYLITYANCPIVWGSKMQSLVALSTMEAKLIAMSTARCEVIHLQNLLLELCGCNFPIPFTKPQVVCRTFEDNATSIEVAQSDHKIHPRTKHISVCLFHFRDHVEKQLITIEHVPSKYQLADIFTKRINTCAYAIKSWVDIHSTCSTRGSVKLLWDRHLNKKCLPTSAQYCLEQYCIFYSTSNRFHLSFVYFT